MDNYTLVIPDEYFDKIKSGEINLALRVNDTKRRNYKVGNVLTFKKQSDESDEFKVEISNLFYFDTIKDALLGFGKKRFGYTESITADKIEDKMLMFYKNEDIEKYGIVIIEIKIKD